MKALKLIFIILLALSVVYLIAYIEMTLGITADICFIPNLFIGSAIGLYSLHHAINIWED